MGATHYKCDDLYISNKSIFFLILYQKGHKMMLTAGVVGSAFTVRPS